MVLQSIEKALELVENKTPEKASYTNNMAGSPLRLREKINSVLHSSSPPNPARSPQNRSIHIRHCPDPRRRKISHHFRHFE